MGERDLWCVLYTNNCVHCITKNNSFPQIVYLSVGTSSVTVIYGVHCPIIMQISVFSVLIVIIQIQSFSLFMIYFTDLMIYPDLHKIVTVFNKL